MLQLVLPLSDEERLRPDKDCERRLRKVLRLRPGDRVQVLDPDRGRVAQAELEADGFLRIRQARDLPPDPHPDLELVAASLHSDRLEEALVRTFELGLKAVHICRGDRSQKAPSPRLEERLERLARASLEQSGRLHSPQISLGGTLLEALASRKDLQRELYVFDPRGEPLGGIKPPASLFLGPEGGLSPGELEAARSLGARVVSLGGHILRAETAVVAVVARALAQVPWSPEAPSFHSTE